jgi:NTE family protein
MAERPTLGMALGSGAARGWAHIGILRALAD